MKRLNAVKLLGSAMSVLLLFGGCAHPAASGSGTVSGAPAASAAVSAAGLASDDASLSRAASGASGAMSAGAAVSGSVRSGPSGAAVSAPHGASAAVSRAGGSAGNSGAGRVGAVGAAAGSASSSRSASVTGPQVTLSINCATAVAYFRQEGKPADSKIVPSNGVILAPTAVPLRSGDTVYTVLTRTAEAHGITVDAATAGTIYVRGINGLYAAGCGLTKLFCGAESGWIYYVNETGATVSCGQYKPKNGDRIDWKYTCSFGSDVSG